MNSQHPVLDTRQLDTDLSSTSEPIAVFRETLRKGKQTLQDRFEANEDIETIVRDYAHMIDEILQRAWRHTFGDSYHQAALIAVGGYGRQELHPGSDIDLLLLFDKDNLESSRKTIETFLTMLWDIGMEVGQSVRTIDDCVNESIQDVTVITNLVESRFLDGSLDLFGQMTEATSIDRIWPSDQFFEAKYEEQKRRHLRFDDTAYKLEPNIKESPGGLRDIHMIGWVAKRHFGARDLHELVGYNFLTEDEYHSLIQGQNLLWKIRFALHILTGRREDRLLFDHQKTLALSFGFNDDGHNRAVEQFMQQYYRTVMELDRLNEMLLQHFQEAILYAQEPATPTPINSRFQVTRGFIEVTHDNVFKHYPYALLEIFLLLQLHPELKGVRATTIRLIRANKDLIDDTVRNDLRTNSIFMEILRQPSGITHELRRMNRYGILAAYLPPFANIVGRMQYDLFHHYTVDEHILFVVRNLRRFTIPEFYDEYPLCSELIQSIAKPELLYIAGLYHDIAKGRGGDHSELGEDEAIHFCRSHGLGEYDTRLVAWLVRNHLIMSMTAQRKDLSDPEVIHEFAALVDDQTHLDYIYLLTVADIRATNPETWNSWKDALLRELYYATRKTLRMRTVELFTSKELINSKKHDALKLLKDSEFTRDMADNIWSRLPQEYFVRYNPEVMAWHLQIIGHAQSTDLPLIRVQLDELRGTTCIFIYGPTRLNQFATTTACLERIGLNVVDARIIGTDDRYTLDTYQVLEQNLNTLHDSRRLDEIRDALQQELTREDTDDIVVRRRLPRQYKHFDINTEISFSQDDHNHRTILEVTTADRPGLLSLIGQAFKQCGIRLHKAKIATIGARIEDIFYITNKDRQPLDKEQFMKLEECLLEQLD
jgi:[protein-PII] uridylyltransferase